jgi:hypothetical protein
MMKLYAIRVAIAFDQLVNTVLGGYPNETISVRAWRLGDLGGDRRWALLRKTIDTIMAFDPDHCEETYRYCKEPMKSCGRYLPVECAGCSKYDVEK